MSEGNFLVVSDKPGIAKNLETRLLDLGYSALGVPPCEVLEKVGSLSPRLVLIDIQGDAVEAVKTALVIRTRHQVPVIFLTAEPESISLASSDEASPFPSLVKPFQDQELRAVIESVLCQPQAETKIGSFSPFYKTLSQINQEAQAALHRSEERYRSLVRAGAQIVWTAPAHGDQTGDAMPEWQNFTGQTTQEMAGRGWLDAIHPDDQQETFAVWSRIVAAGEVAEFENRVRRHDGVFRNMLVRAVPVRDQAGDLVEWVGMNIDVTEKKQAEEELRRAQDKLAGEKIYLEQELRCILGTDLIGRSTGLKAVLDKVAKVANTTANVLVLGETGTGKELVARAVHRMSLRRDQSFIKMNCAAIPSGLLESELFGHEKGAFTGAVNRKLGRVELADGGTLFLDEIAEIPLDLQPKLLRVLQDQECERLGGTQTIKVNFRLIAATNADLLQNVKDGCFRRDLYYRLHVFPIHVPALRERKEDIPLLVKFFAKKFAAKMNKPVIAIPPGTMDALMDWNWPGNIRELENFMERSVILTRGSTLEAPLPELLVPFGDESNDLESRTRAQILRTLRETGGQLSGPRGAAARLGLTRTTLQSKLKKMGIDPRRFVA